jgi:uncharacterized membrane protein
MKDVFSCLAQRRWLLPALVALVALLLLSAAALAANGYQISWWTVDGGGGRSAGAGYALNGSLGQPDAGPTLSGGNYRLAGGFWSGGGVSLNEIYLPLING